MLYLQKVAVGLLITDSAAQVLFGRALPLLEPGAHGPTVPPRGQIESHRPTLPVDDPELSTVRLDHARDEKVVTLRVEDVLVEDRTAVSPVEVPPVHERKGDEVAGSPDEEIDVLRAPVHEVHLPSIQSLDVRLRRDGSVLHEVGQERVHDRMRLEETVVRLAEPEVLVTAHGQAKRDVGDDPLDAHRYAQGVHEARHLIRGLAPEVLGHIVVAPARAVERGLGLVCRFHHDVTTGVPTAHHKDPPAHEDLGDLVVGGVHHVSGEMPVILGRQRLLIVPVGDHQRLIAVAHGRPA